MAQHTSFLVGLGFFALINFCVQLTVWLNKLHYLARCEGQECGLRQSGKINEHKVDRQEQLKNIVFTRFKARLGLWTCTDFDGERHIPKYNRISKIQLVLRQ